jgi:hypothetical protein
MPAEPRPPTHSDLVADLRLVREKGLGRLRQYATPAFHLSRSDYTTTLAQFLEQAQSSVVMVSMSLKTKGAENEVAQVFRRLLAKSPQFRVIVSLIKPNSPACQAASAILGLPHEIFRSEVESMLTDLDALRQRLPTHQASRLYLLATCRDSEFQWHLD